MSIRYLLHFIFVLTNRETEIYWENYSTINVQKCFDTKKIQNVLAILQILYLQGILKMFY